jgi:hypothetical protein
MSEYYQAVSFEDATGKDDFGVFVGDPRRKAERMWLRPVTLPVSGWVSLEDRKPTAEDADEYGQILLRIKGCARTVMESWYYDATFPEAATHFQPIAKFAPKVPSFGEWLMQQQDHREYTNGNKGFRIEWLTKKHAEYQQKYGEKK